MSALAMSRRTILAGALAAALPVPRVHAARASGLRRAARDRGILLGSAIDLRAVEPAQDVLDLVARECSAVVPENAGKWKWIEPVEGRYRWGAMDRTVAFARAHGMQVNWHVLLWQNGGLPDFMKLPASQGPSPSPEAASYHSASGTLSPRNWRTRFSRFVEAIAARYGDSFHRIDVANEVFLPADRGAEEVDEHGFRKGNWWQVAGGAEGPEWVDTFFHIARRAFPSARLVVNEFGIEQANDRHRSKRAALIRWLAGARARGCPVDGVGLQSHLVLGETYDTAGMAGFAREASRHGLSLHVTELDVNGRQVARSMPLERQDRAAARLAAHHVETLLAHAGGGLAEISFWGLRSDRNHIVRRFGLPLHPSPFDAGGEPLPLYHAIREVLETRS